MSDVTLTLVGGPTLLIEIDGFRLLTDPTFDAPGTYPSGHITLEKVHGPALQPEAIGRVDAVLLSHDQHADNLDRSGRTFLTANTSRVFTTQAGAERLGGEVTGLAPWEDAVIGKDGRALHITAVPARHGPPGIEPISGDVVGFVIGRERPGDAIYVSGDTVWYEGVAEIAQRFRPRLAVLFTGAARPRGAFHMTMDSNDALEAARAFKDAAIVSVHNDGWAHFTESEAELQRSFAALGVGARYHTLAPGQPLQLPI